MLLFKYLTVDLNALKKRDLDNRSLSIGDLIFLLFSYTGYALTLIRLQSGTRNRLIRHFAKRRLRSKYLIEMGDNVSIGIPFRLPHPRNIIIAGETIIGNNVQINQNVTIGGNNRKQVVLPNGTIQKLPIIGNDVVIFAGAVVAGPVQIGNSVLIGANCTVSHDVESNSMIYSSMKTSKKKIQIPREGGTYKVIE